MSIFGQQAFAFSENSTFKDPDQRFYFQVDQNAEGSFFQEISNIHFGQYFESQSNFLSNPGAFATTSNLHFQKASELKISDSFLQDHRNSLSQQIFPFHFFW